MTNVSEAKQSAHDWIEANRQRLSDFDLEIWDYSEPAWREYRSARAYVDLLRKEGFEVEEGSGGMPTAFAATWSQGEGGPVLGSFAEYDAVPGNSQQAVPYQAPREGLHPWAPGHTDPHSMLGAAALTGILGAKAAMEKHGLSGTLKLFGEPAEKMCGSKPVHAAKGYFDGIDAFVLYHPRAENTVAYETHSGSYWSVVFTFESDKAETWIDGSLVPSFGPHTVARAPGAIDALCLMYTNTKYTKEAMFPHTSTWTLNEFVLAAGDATSDNLSPRFSQIQYSWRSPTLGIQEQILNVLMNNAKHAAGVSHCRVSMRWVAKTRVGLPNLTMARLAYANMEQVGPPSYSDEVLEFGREIQRNLNIEPMDNPYLDTHTQLTPPDEQEVKLRTMLPSWQQNFTSDDYVEYTWHAPTARVYTARLRLKPPTAGYQYPAWADNALPGVADAMDPGMFLAGKTVAGTLVDLLTDSDLLQQAKAEFNERTGGGIGGSKWVAPLLPKDFRAPINLRWPEYIQTERGSEWWIPTPEDREDGMGEKL